RGGDPPSPWERGSPVFFTFPRPTWRRGVLVHSRPRGRCGGPGPSAAPPGLPHGPVRPRWARAALLASRTTTPDRPRGPRRFARLPDYNSRQAARPAPLCSPPGLQLPTGRAARAALLASRTTTPDRPHGRRRFARLPDYNSRQAARPAPLCSPPGLQLPAGRAAPGALLGRDCGSRRAPRPLRVPSEPGLAPRRRPGCSPSVSPSRKSVSAPPGPRKYPRCPSPDPQVPLRVPKSARPPSPTCPQNAPFVYPRTPKCFPTASPTPKCPSRPSNDPASTRNWIPSALRVSPRNWRDDDDVEKDPDPIAVSATVQPLIEFESKLQLPMRGTDNLPHFFVPLPWSLLEPGKLQEKHSCMMCTSKISWELGTESVW
ncbi:uncharacterized protein, partial [Taeniopygia guttata]|uniref:uncharacterized protein n=1 Tax=Taeniopygia guttata TaxID=59729 RepID=UPI003BB8C8D7